METYMDQLVSRVMSSMGIKLESVTDELIANANGGLRNVNLLARFVAIVCQILDFTTKGHKQGKEKEDKAKEAAEINLTICGIIAKGVEFSNRNSVVPYSIRQRATESLVRCLIDSGRFVDAYNVSHGHRIFLEVSEALTSEALEAFQKEYTGSAQPNLSQFIKNMMN